MEIVRLLVQDSESTAEAILGCLTLYLLPCLYGYLGAAAATMYDLRRKVERSQLRYTDRGRIAYNERLGALFGAVIALCANPLTKMDAANGLTLPANGLTLSALALLAGYNVPGVLAFLDDLSNRIFRPGERAASRPAV